MNPYWIIILTIGQGALCGEVCTYQVGTTTFTTTCSGSKYCCENNTNCCSRLSTGAIIAFAVGGTVFLGLIVGVLIYSIVKHKKKNSSVTPVQSARSSTNDQPPPYTPHVMANHPPPGAPPQYDAIASYSGTPPNGYAPTQQTERKIPL